MASAEKQIARVSQEELNFYFLTLVTKIINSLFYKTFINTHLFRYILRSVSFDMQTFLLYHKY